MPKEFAAKFNARRRALLAGLKLLGDMETSGALRLPYPGLADTKKQMDDAL